MGVGDLVSDGLEGQVDERQKELAKLEQDKKQTAIAKLEKDLTEMLRGVTAKEIKENVENIGRQSALTLLIYGYANGIYTAANLKKVEVLSLLTVPELSEAYRRLTEYTTVEAKKNNPKAG